MLYPFSRFFSPARSRSNCGPAARKKRGFSLIEAAIVLGVVGLVIGGIWVAAAAVSENRRLNQAVSGTLLLIDRARTRIPTTLEGGAVTLNHDMAADLVSDVDGFSVSAGIGLISPWNQPVNLGLSSTAVSIFFLSLTKSSCRKLAYAITSRFKDTTDLTIVSASFSSSSKFFTSFPIPVSDSTLCTSSWGGSTNYVSFDFKR